jgi:hypothetical protein
LFLKTKIQIRKAAKPATTAKAPTAIPAIAPPDILLFLLTGLDTGVVEAGLDDVVPDPTELPVVELGAEEVGYNS